MSLTYDIKLPEKMSETDRGISKDIWEKFVGHYNFVGKSGRLIRYPDKDYKKNGVPSPWQTIAWRKVIRLIGEDNIKDIPFDLNYLGNSDVLFRTDFIDNFGSYEYPEDLEISFICGYFWLYIKDRRDKMLNFVVDDLLKKGSRVIIWTQDKTLKGDLEKTCSEKLGHPIGKDKLEVHWVRQRIDIHYTLVENTKAPEKSRIFLELPHTEAYEFRLETYFTFREFKSLNCEIEAFKKALRGYLPVPGYLLRYCVKILLSSFNRAYNTERD